MQRNVFARYIPAAFLALVVAAPFLVQRLARLGHDTSTRTTPSWQPRLVIMTPHSDQTRSTFAHGYNAWRRHRGETEVHFDFRTMGGTSDLRKQIFSQFHALARHRRENDGIGVDLFFGGGPYEHDKIADGLTVSRDGRKVAIPLSVPIEVTPEELNSIFPEESIGGEPLLRRDASTGRPLWVGTALSSFGIVANHDVLKMLALPLPHTWSDLCDPRYAGWIAMADPGHSGSVAATCNTVLQRKGWHHGWAILRRVFANARYFASSASKVPLDVAAGEAAAGMCIDFYGRYQAGAMPDHRIAYIDPRESRHDDAPLETAVTADPISVLRGGPASLLAHEFVRWLLTPEAQRLWQRRPGTEGGPVQYALRRIPVRKDLFTAEEMSHWTDPSNPFLSAKPLPPRMPNFYRLVAPLAHAMAIDVHDDLRAAWHAINTHPDGDCRRRMLALFDAMPHQSPGDQHDHGLTIQWAPGMSPRQVAAVLSDPADPGYGEVIGTIATFADHLKQRYTKPGSRRHWDHGAKLRRDRLAWMRFFRSNYRRIVDMANSDPTCASTASERLGRSYPPSSTEAIRPPQWRAAAAVN